MWSHFLYIVNILVLSCFKTAAAWQMCTKLGCIPVSQVLGGCGAGGRAAVGLAVRLRLSETRHHPARAAARAGLLSRAQQERPWPVCPHQLGERPRRWTSTEGWHFESLTRLHLLRSLTPSLFVVFNLLGVVKTIGFLSAVPCFLTPPGNQWSNSGSYWRS